MDIPCQRAARGEYAVPGTNTRHSVQQREVQPISALEGAAEKREECLATLSGARLLQGSSGRGQAVRSAGNVPTYILFLLIDGIEPELLNRAYCTGAFVKSMAGSAVLWMEGTVPDAAPGRHSSCKPRNLTPHGVPQQSLAALAWRRQCNS